MADTNGLNTKKPQSASFTRELRLLSSSEFKTVFEQTAYKASSRQILLLASKNDVEHARLGFVLAKKQIKLAVDRNRVKRIIRESFRHSYPTLEGIDVVVLARPGLDKLDNKDIRKLIDGLWHRLKPVNHDSNKQRRK